MKTALPRTDRLEWWPRANLRPNPDNVREHDDAQVEVIAGSMQRHGWTFPILVAEDAKQPGHGMIVAGHARFDAALLAGFTDEAKVLVAENWSDQMIAEYTLLDNQVALLATWNESKLVVELERIKSNFGGGAIRQLGFSQDQLDAYFNPKPEQRHVSGSLAEKFGVPPFSIINTAKGWWQNRKGLWLNLRIKSEIGRGDMPLSSASQKPSGTNANRRSRSSSGGGSARARINPSS